MKSPSPSPDPLPSPDPPPNVSAEVPLADALALLTALLKRHGATDPDALARALVAAILVMRAPPNVVPPRDPLHPVASPVALVAGDDGLPADPELRVILTGGLGRDDFHGLVIQKGSRVASFRLTRPEFVCLVVLGCLARKNARLPVGFPVQGGSHLPPRRIIETMDEWQRVEPKLDGAFDDDTGDDVYRWVHQIRKRLADAAIAPDLIENGGSRKGYRLAVLPHNIFIYLR